MERHKVFISYSWDSKEHQNWVLDLANNLISVYGINVILDQFELSAGKDLTYFMEQSIEKSDKVLLILTPNYKIKAENRKKGVGYETSMISSELLSSQIFNIKFIPILREGSSEESMPKFLKSKIFHDMRNQKDYDNKLYDLVKLINNQRLKIKPQFGESKTYGSTKTSNKNRLRIFDSKPINRITTYSSHNYYFIKSLKLFLVGFISLFAGAEYGSVEMDEPISIISFLIFLIVIPFFLYNFLKALYLWLVQKKVKNSRG